MLGPMRKRPTRLVFRIYFGTCGKKHASQATPGTNDFSGLKWVIRSFIDNHETSAILQEVFQGVSPNTPLKSTPDDDDQEKSAFWALLGSPNGYAANRMCTDHKEALRGKGVKSMNAIYFPMENDVMAMFIWAEIAYINNDNSILSSRVGLCGRQREVQLGYYQA